jgi:hypothetical protein
MLTVKCDVCAGMPLPQEVTTQVEVTTTARSTAVGDRSMNLAGKVGVSIEGETLNIGCTTTMWVDSPSGRRGGDAIRWYALPLRVYLRSGLNSPIRRTCTIRDDAEMMYAAIMHQTTDEYAAEIRNAVQLALIRRREETGLPIPAEAVGYQMSAGTTAAGTGAAAAAETAAAATGAAAEVIGSMLRHSGQERGSEGVPQVHVNTRATVIGPSGVEMPSSTVGQQGTGATGEASTSHGAAAQPRTYLPGLPFLSAVPPVTTTPTLGSVEEGQGVQVGGAGAPVSSEGGLRGTGEGSAGLVDQQVAASAAQSPAAAEPAAHLDEGEYDSPSDEDFPTAVLEAAGQPLGPGSPEVEGIGDVEITVEEWASLFDYDSE